MRTRKEKLYQEGPVIRTGSGTYVDVMNPTEDMIRVGDIAWALAGQPRFGGHLNVRYTVAMHSCWVCQAIPDEGLKLEGLLHDAAEAYLLDLPRPIKNHLPEYHVMENRLLEVIGRKFHVELTPMHEMVERYDTLALEREWEAYMIGEPTRGTDRSVLPAGGYHEFLELFRKYKRT